MNKQEFSLVIVAIQTAYPSFKHIETKEAAKVWYTMLQDLDYDRVQKALMNHISNSQYPPSIAEIRALCVDNNLLDESSAWAMVLKACKRGLYNSAEEFLKLPESVQRALGSHEVIKSLAMLDEATLNSVERSNFLKSYRSIQARQKNNVPERFRLESNDEPIRLPVLEEPRQDEGYPELSDRDFLNEFDEMMKGV